MSDMARHTHAPGWKDVRKKPSGKWEARWIDETGAVKGRSFVDKAVAAKLADDMARESERAAVGLGVTHKPIVNALAAFQDRRLDPKTVDLNGRRMKEFLLAFPALTLVDQITDTHINTFDRMLEAKGCNPGGRNHHLRIVRTFCKFCRDKNWLPTNPFLNFKMPKSDFEGRACTEEEFERMCSIGWVGGNKISDTYGIGWQGGNQYKDVDLWLRRAFRFGRETMLRVSQVWKLTPEDFREPGEIRVKGIKGQESEWKPLTEIALEVLRELLQVTKPGQRFFSYWSSVASLQQAVQKKATRVGLKGLRFHDVCKVTRVSQLDAAGFSIKEISQVSNTTPRTLLAHYIKPDKQKTFDKYRAFAQARPASDPPETKLSGNLGVSQPQGGIESTTDNTQNGSTSRQISNL